MAFRKCVPLPLDHLKDDAYLYYSIRCEIVICICRQDITKARKSPKSPIARLGPGRALKYKPIIFAGWAGLGFNNNGLCGFWAGPGRPSPIDTPNCNEWPNHCFIYQKEL